MLRKRVQRPDPEHLKVRFARLSSGLGHMMQICSSASKSVAVHVIISKEIVVTQIFRY